RTAAEAARDVFEDVRWLSDPKAPTTVPKTGAINPVRGGHTPVPIASRLAPAAARLADAFELLLAPRLALAASRPAQADFVRALDPRTILKGLAAADRLEREARDLRRRFGTFVRWGSNAWVVSPSRSERGHALLWGGSAEG